MSGHWEEMEGNDITTLPLLHGEGVFEGTSNVFVVFFPSLVLSPQGRDLREWGRWTDERGVERKRERERAREESSIVGAEPVRFPAFSLAERSELFLKSSAETLIGWMWVFL